MFSRDGNLLASGGVDNCVKLWNARSICNPDDDDDEGTDPNHASTKSNTFEVPNQEDSSALFTLHAKKSVISVRTFHSCIMRA
ncbi:transcription initiation factor TFIID subunit 5-like [Pocillopora verrucosa]|uniref:transcription initiation factor TFIID subunit 5-like n=1 Tax=Pocillopora verrucosa TaxID=203993 RepID=UPI003342998A